MCARLVTVTSAASISWRGQRSPHSRLVTDCARWLAASTVSIAGHCRLRPGRCAVSLHHVRRGQLSLVHVRPALGAAIATPTVALSATSAAIALSAAALALSSAAVAVAATSNPVTATSVPIAATTVAFAASALSATTTAIAPTSGMWLAMERRADLLLLAQQPWCRKPLLPVGSGRCRRTFPRRWSASSRRGLRVLTAGR